MLRELTQDRAQAVVLTAFGLSLFAMFGALSVDVGLLVNERRELQNAADKAALAGALEILLTDTDTGADALAEAEAWAAANGVDPSEDQVELVYGDRCFGVATTYPTGVEVSVSREPASFLVGLLDIDSWEASANAVACAGRPIDTFGVLPFALSETSSCFVGGLPKLGEYCDMVVDTNEQGLSGELGIADDIACDAGNGSANEIEENIIEGAQVTCSVGQFVEGNPGHNVGKTKSGIVGRFTTDGACDASTDVDASTFAAGNLAMDNYSASPLKSPSRGDGADDLFEVWEYQGDADNPADNLAPHDCDASTPGLQTSPRNVTVLVIHDYANPDGDDNKTYEVLGFARMYLEGCTDKDGDFHKDCDWSGGGKFTVHARFVEQAGLTNSELGLKTEYGDIEVKLVE